MKLVKEKPVKELQVYIEDIESCDFCEKEKVKGFSIVDGYHYICFTCVRELYKIIITPAREL